MKRHHWLKAYSRNDLETLFMKLKEEIEKLQDQPLDKTEKPYYFSLLEENARLKEENEELRAFIHCGQLCQGQLKNGKMKR